MLARSGKFLALTAAAVYAHVIGEQVPKCWGGEGGGRSI